jgi:hypothetical protein
MRDGHPLIDFVGVGPPKTGTTWLHACLCGHPDLCLPQQKETYFFDRHFDRGFDWYRRQFKCSADVLRGEIGASYFGNPSALERIHRHNERCKVIVNLRDPVARTFSFYLHYRRKERLRADFLTSLTEMPKLFESSRYDVLLPRWIESFGRDRVLIILLEDVAAFPEEELRRVHDFLEIGNWMNHDVIGQRVHAASMPRYPRVARVADRVATQMRRKELDWAVDFAKRIGMRRIYRGSPVDLSLDASTRASLIERFLPTIEYVEDFLDRPLPEWKAVEMEPARSESS